MITGRVVGDKEIAATLKSLPDKIRAGMRRQVVAFSLDLRAYVVGSKLSGSPLKRVTGTLADSIGTDFLDAGQSVYARVGDLSKAVEYAAVHEYGFSDMVTVKAHPRNIKMAWGRPITPKTIQVSAFSKFMYVREKKYLRGSLEEKKAQFFERMEKMVDQGIADAGA